MGRAFVSGWIVVVWLAVGQLAPGQSQSARDRVVDFRLEGGLSDPSGLDVEAAARRYLEERLGRSEVEYTLDARSTSFEGAVEHLTFTPRVAGIPYFEAAVQVHVDRQGRVIRFEAPKNLPLPRDLVFHADAKRAGVVALARMGATGPTAASRTWFRAAGQARPAWTVYVEAEGGAPRQLVIDAETEDVLYERILAQRAEPDGYVFPAPEIQNPSLGSYQLRFLSGRVGTGPACPQPIYPTLFASSGLCWTDGAATVGNNVDACLDVDTNDVCDGRALGSAGRFLYPFQNAYDLSLNAAPDRSAALVNAFYWTNVAHDWLYKLGFDEASGNFQQDNFGRGGYGGDRLRLDVQDGGTTNNAWFSTPPDGIAPRMQLGLWPGARRDGAFDGDVILHEYVHGLTNRLVGGPFDAGALFLWHSGAMGEGWSDVLAASFTGDPVIGEYSTRNAATGVRTVRYDQSALTFGQFGTRRLAVLPVSTTLAGLPAVHRDGEIWASALWDLRQILGAASFEPIVVAALKLTPRRPSMLDGRDAILQAASLAGLSSPQICQLWNAFAARGMGASAALNPVGPGEWADSALSVYESFDGPASCGGSAPVLNAIVLEEGAESASSWTATGQWHRTQRRASAGSQSWWFGREETGVYETGTRVSGSLTSPMIDLSGRTAAVLEWRQFFRGEGFLRPIDVGGGLDPYLNLDSGRVWVSADDGRSWMVLTHIAHETPGSGFAVFRVNLSRYAGQAIRLRFEFDTFTASGNAHEGWYLDEVRVRASGAPPQLQVSPLSLSFSGSAQQTVSIANAGEGGLQWTAAAPAAPWLSLSPAGGTAPSTLTVSANAAGLAPGQYSAAINIDAGAAGHASIPVTMLVEGSPSPVAAWSFEESGAGPGVWLLDQTGQGRNGLTNGVGSASARGVSGRGRLFNGRGDGVTVAADAELTPVRMSVRVWVRMLTLPSSFGVIVSQFGGANAKGWYLAVRSTGEVVLMGATPPSSMPWLVSSGRLTLGRWHQVTATFDRSSGQVALYLDGALDRTATLPGINADPAAPLIFGRASWTNSYYLKAVLDEATILPFVLPPAGVTQDFAGFSPPAPIANSQVSAEWTFDSGLQDESGNAFHPTQGGGQAVPGVRGTARRIAGVGDALQITIDEDLNPPSFTARIWVKLAQAPSAWGDLISNYGAQFAGWRLGVTAAGKPFFAVASKPSSLPSVEGSAGLTPGRWTALTAVYDGAQRSMKLYVDGQLAAQRFGVDMTPRTEGVMTIGRAAWTNTNPVIADIDEALIVPMAWTAGQVREDHKSYAVAAQTEGGLIAQWSFEETAVGSGVVFADATGRGHGLTASGARHGPLTGLFHNARRFGGYPDVATAAGPNDFAVNRFTFSAWVRLDQYPSSWGALFGNYDGAFAGWYAGIHPDGRIILCVAGPGSKPWMLSSRSLSLGRWHHVAVTFDGASRAGRIYLDGNQVATGTFPAWAVASGVVPTMGRAPWAQTGWLAFSIDEARFFSSVLAPEEVFTEYATLAGLVDPAPMAEWLFDGNPSATAAADSTGRGHHAQIEDPGAMAVEGLWGGAWRFSGLGGASIEPHPDLSSPAFTLDSWIKLEALPSSWGVLYSSYAPDGRGWYLAVHPDGRLILCVASTSGGTPWMLSSGAIAPGQWTHVAATFDSVSRKGAIYLDGALDRAAAFPGYTPQSDQPASLATAPWAPGHALHVTLDRTRVWAQERTAQEIAASLAP